MLSYNNATCFAQCFCPTSLPVDHRARDSLIRMSSGKKRKASSQETGRPSKKQQLIGSVKVNHTHGSDTTKPVIGKLDHIEKRSYTTY